MVEIKNSCGISSAIKKILIIFLIITSSTYANSLTPRNKICSELFERVIKKSAFDNNTEYFTAWIKQNARDMDDFLSVKLAKEFNLYLSLTKSPAEFTLALQTMKKLTEVLVSGPKDENIPLFLFIARSLPNINMAKYFLKYTNNFSSEEIKQINHVFYAFENPDRFLNLDIESTAKNMKNYFLPFKLHLKSNNEEELHDFLSLMDSSWGNPYIININTDTFITAWMSKLKN